MSDILRLSPAQYEVIIEHARSCEPEEACGILGGYDGSVEQVYLMENAEHSDSFYMMDSREQFRVFDEIEKEGLELVGIFHSHPHSPPYPSAQDLELAFYPDAFYMIVSLMGDVPETRVFRIVQKQVAEVELVLEDDE